MRSSRLRRALILLVCTALTLWALSLVSASPRRAGGSHVLRAASAAGTQPARRRAKSPGASQPTAPSAPSIPPLAAAFPRWPRLSGVPAFHWPPGVQGALAVIGSGWLSQVGPASPRPIASVAKVMTAYLILADHPLVDGSSGPVITVTPADVARYRFDASTDQSSFPVAVGERLTERQALIALLLPSANNIAWLLARWDAGSVPAFVARMNIMAHELGLTATSYAGPAGFNPATVSTAADQVRLAADALNDPAFAALVGTRISKLPVGTVVFNVNGLLGFDGVIGVKTGTSAQAGACLVFAARQQIGARSVLVVGALLGGPKFPLLYATFNVTAQLLARVKQVLTQRYEHGLG